MSTSLEPLEPMIFTSSYELCSCLVAKGQNQHSSIAKVISSDQVGNELWPTLRKSFNLPINLGLGLALQDPVLVQHLYTGLDNITFGGVFLEVGLSLLVGTLLALAFMMKF